MTDQTEADDSESNGLTQGDNSGMGRCAGCETSVPRHERMDLRAKPGDAGSTGEIVTLLLCDACKLAALSEIEERLRGGDDVEDEAEHNG